MGQAIDFEKQRQKRRRSKLVKRVAILGAIVVVLLGILSINSLLADVGLLTRISDFVQSFGGGGYPIAVPGGTLRDTKDVSGDIAVLNDTTLFVYNQNGREVLAVQQLGESSVLTAGGGRILAYDIGGTKYTLCSRTRVLLEGVVEYGMMTAALGERGDYALVTASRQYLAQVTVYNQNFEQTFEWRSASQHIVDVSLSPRGTHLAAVGLETQGGVLRSTLNVFELSAEGEPARVEFPDELVLQAEYGADAIFLLSDSCVRLLRESGETLAQYDFGGRSPKLVQRGDAGTLLVLEDDDRVQTAVLLDSALQERGAAALSSKVTGAAVGREVYLLSEEGVTVYSDRMEPQGEPEHRDAVRVLYAGGKLYYFTSDEIRILETVSATRTASSASEEDAEDSADEAVGANSATIANGADDLNDRGEADSAGGANGAQDMDEMGAGQEIHQ